MAFAAVGFLLELAKLQFDGAQGPELLLGERGQRRSRLVEFTDVSPFLDLASVVLVEEAKRKPLRPADVGSALVDPAGPVAV